MQDPAPHRRTWRVSRLSRRRFLSRLFWLTAAVASALRLPSSAAATHDATPTPASDETPSPLALYLTWQRDPTTTMTIQWHSKSAEGAHYVTYGPRDGALVGRVAAATRPMPYSDRHVHTAELTGLRPGSQYGFRVHDEVGGYVSPAYWFRTMPETTDEPVRVVMGGDILTDREWLVETCREVMRTGPDFIVWGGDLAYAGARAWHATRWYTLFEVMRDELISDEGRVVPVIMGIGNHEVRDHYFFGGDRGAESYQDSDDFREYLAPYYFALIAFPGQPGYACLDFGNWLSLVFLDTDHANPIEGKQTQWLADALAARRDVTHVFPVYHVPGWPSARRFNGDFWVSHRVRESWHPLFEDAGVRVAFEHHDHAYKRTVPIRRMEEDESGVVYLGDGGWGVPLREVHDIERYSYLERAQSVRHFILATIHGDDLEFKAISHTGEVIDHFVPAPSQGGLLDRFLHGVDRMTQRLRALLGGSE